MDDTEDVFPVRLDAGLPARRDSPLPPSIRSGPYVYGPIVIDSISIRDTKDKDIRHDF